MLKLLQFIMQDEENCGKRKRMGGNYQLRGRKKTRQVSQILYTSNLKEVLDRKEEERVKIDQITQKVRSYNRPKKEPEVNTNLILSSGFYLGDGERERRQIQEKYIENLPIVIRTLDEVKDIIIRKNIKSKQQNGQNPVQHENWMVFCKVTMIWNWKGNIRFFITDEKGTEVKCQLQKDAADQEYREFLKSGRYYLFSRGIAVLDKQKNLLISFPRWAKITPRDDGHFKINPATTIRIHQVVEHPIQSKLNVVGVVKEVKVLDSENKKKHSIILCDPIFKFQIQAKQLVILADEKAIAQGDIIILHGFILIEKYGNTLALSSGPESYHSFQNDIRDQLILSYMKAISNSNWKSYKYDIFRKVRFLQNTLKNLIDYKSMDENEHVFSIIDGEIFKVVTGNAIDTKKSHSNNSQSHEPKIYDLIVTLDDDTARVNFNISWYMISSFSQLTLEKYKIQCYNKAELDIYLRRLVKTKVRLKVKSFPNKEGRLQNCVESIETLAKSKTN